MTRAAEAAAVRDGVQILSSRLPRLVLGLVAVLAVLGVAVVAALQWQQRTIDVLERRANAFHRASIADAAQALASLAEAESRALRTERDFPAEPPAPANWREVRSLAYSALAHVEALERLQAAWDDPDFAATVQRLSARRADFAAALEPLQGLDAAARALVGPGSGPLRHTLEQLRQLHDAAYDRTVKGLRERQRVGVWVLGGLAIAALLAGAVVVWRILRLIRADVLRQREMHSALHRYVAMLGAAQRGGRVGLWHMNYTTGELTASQEAWELLDLPEAQRNLAGFRMAVHPDDRARFQATVQDAIGRGEHFSVQYRVATADGEIRHIHARAGRGSESPAGEDVLSGTIRDITEQVRAEAELAHYRGQLEQMVEQRTSELSAVNRELESFSYSVSHDLRGPLRGIDGFSQALLEEYGAALDDTGRDYLRRVRTGVQRMGRLIDDLLRLSRVSRLELHVETVDLSTLAEAVLQQLGQGDPAAAVHWHVQPGLVTRGDMGLLQILLENLLGNARKFSARVPHPRIEFAAEERGGTVVYRVRDNGAGFDMRFADKLFGAFQRLHDAAEFEGTGVGLATAQRIVHRHGGRIWAEGHPGAGATFYFTLSGVTATMPSR